MKRTQKLLMTLLVSMVCLAATILLVFETGLLESGIGAGGNVNLEFAVTSVMELVTLACAFLSLRLFKFSKVHGDLVARKEAALGKWGVIRLLMLGIPLVLDTLLYYIYMNPTFGYLAIILLLCLPFVWPSMNRCMAETVEEG